MRQILQFDPVAGFCFVPGIRARLPHEGGGYLVRANESGFRCDHAFRAEKPEGRRRILLFGDSFTAGEGVSNGQRYGDLLESLAPDVQVYNFGMPATGTDQQYLLYREYARHIEHDLLVLGVFVENIRRVVSRYRFFVDDDGRDVLYAKPYFTLGEDGLELHAWPPSKRPVDAADLSQEERDAIFTHGRFPRLKGVLNRLRTHPRFERSVVASGLKDRLLRLVRYEPLVDYDDPKGPAWLLMREILHRWISGHDGPVLLVPIPLYHYVAELSDPSSYQTRLREVAKDAGGHYFDPLADLRARSAEERRGLYFPHDEHLTRAGHRALAESLAPAVEKLLAGGAR